jgi:hypothetical protein
VSEKAPRRAHCWHDDHGSAWEGTVGCTGFGAPRYPERCCWCGARRWRVWGRDPAHGPHAPSGPGHASFEYPPGVPAEFCIAEGRP